MLWLNTESRPFTPSWLKRFCANLNERDLILFDGASPLPRLTWSMFKHESNRAGGLIITTHRGGMLPTLVTTRTCPDLLNSLVHKLVPENEVATRHLYAKHNGNIRDVFRDLYDQWADR